MNFLNDFYRSIWWCYSYYFYFYAIPVVHLLFESHKDIIYENSVKQICLSLIPTLKNVTAPHSNYDYIKGFAFWFSRSVK